MIDISIEEAMLSDSFVSSSSSSSPAAVTNSATALVDDAASMLVRLSVSLSFPSKSVSSCHAIIGKDCS